MSATPREGRNYYEILGVVRTATAKEIEGAFRSLATKWHPDICPNLNDAAKNFKLVVEAYEILGDPEKRRQYDRSQAGHGRRTTFVCATPPAVAPRPYPPVNTLGFSWIPARMADLIQSHSAARVGPDPWDCHPRIRPDLDVQAELQVSPEEAHHGGGIEFSVSFRQPCANCRGEGWFSADRCRTCDGTGTTQQGPRLIQVDIPPGVRNGMVIRVPRAGRFCPESGEFGDLCLEVDVRPCL